MLLHTGVSYTCRSLTDLHVFMYDIDNQVVYFMYVFHVSVARYQPHLVLLVSVEWVNVFRQELYILIHYYFSSDYFTRGSFI
jgi:hypothetical protein